MWNQLKRLLLGKPIATFREAHERLSIPIALAVFAADALSSTAYATEEILRALLGTPFEAYADFISIPVALAIALLMAIVVMSYRQVIAAYPNGGGSYEVARERLGGLPSLVAAGSLLIDYVLTSAVSISAGVAALTSTGLVPASAKVELAILFTFIITLINLRGVKESGRVIAVPAYLFIMAMVLLVGTGLWQLLTGNVSPGQEIALLPTQQELGMFSETSRWALLLIFFRAFSHGCAALTGIEAISNGTKAFKDPIIRNANRTLVIMGCLLATIFIGVTLLAHGFHIMPPPDESETVISMVARVVFGSGTPFYFFVQFTTMVILILAANTSFSGFPRLANILADDGYLPRQLMTLGDRLVFSNGIIILGLVSSLLIIGFGASTHQLMPLYAVGVFLCFTLAQAGMVMHHLHFKQSHWQSGLVINGLGALATAFVTVLLAVEKFREGAWIVLVIIPILVLMFRTIRNHYRSVGRQLALTEVEPLHPRPLKHTVLVLVSSLNRGTLPALEYARSLSEHVEAVHVELRPEFTQRLKDNWTILTADVPIPLVVLPSPYRSVIEPILSYIDEVEARDEDDWVTVIVPEFVTKKFWHNILHNQTAFLIKAVLRFRRGKVVTTVRYYLDE